jgi:hypothetical protein
MAGPKGQNVRGSKPSRDEKGVLHVTKYNDGDPTPARESWDVKENGERTQHHVTVGDNEPINLQTNDYNLGDLYGNFDD